jgi:murein DD-endopeptidase MepM/ murein hydrolase activator NlpD
VTPNPDPTALYRKQQGLDPITQSSDPVVVQWIKQASAQTGADPVVMLATALQESGARRGEVGDQGTSYGPFQFHRGGALGSHTPGWANSYAAILNRAQEFSRLGVHGGPGAAEIQRPADRSLYARGVQSHLDQARAILGRLAPVPHAAAPDSVKTAAATAPADAVSAQNRDLFIQAILNDAPVTDLIGLVQQSGGAGAPASAARAVSPSRQGAPSTTTLSTGKVVSALNPKLIGLPYQGTHKLYGNWESDNAIDIALPRNTPVYAVANGTIGSQIGSLNSSDPHMAGERLHLKIPGNELYYQHLSSIVVKAGQKVKKGQLLGYTGALNHLHLGVKNGQPQRFA